MHALAQRSGDYARHYSFFLSELSALRPLSLSRGVATMWSPRRGQVEVGMDSYCGQGRGAPPPETCANKIPLLSIGGRVEGLACIDPEARTPIDMSRFLIITYILKQLLKA